VVERYVVGVDGSRPGVAALRWAIDRVRRDPAPVVLVHVDEDEAGVMGHDYHEEQSRHGAQLLAEAMVQVVEAAPTVPVSVALLNGGVPWAIASFVHSDDLLVIGTGKTGFLHGRVLGSRSVQIAVAAACTVAVIPEVDLRFRRGVVAGIDRHATAASIVDLGAREACARQEELFLVQSSPTPETRQSASERAVLAVSFATELVRADYPALVVRSRVTSRPPAEALLDSARDKALLVLGPGSLDPFRSPIGSVLHDVLLNVNAPVLIARPRASQQIVGPVPSVEAPAGGLR
jgi:nucleotide-binding universal stress UspA family protein